MDRRSIGIQQLFAALSALVANRSPPQLAGRRTNFTPESTPAGRACVRSPAWLINRDAELRMRIDHLVCAGHTHTIRVCSVRPWLVLLLDRVLTSSDSACRMAVEKYPNNPMLGRRSVVDGKVGTKHDEQLPVSHFFLTVCFAL